MASKFSFEGHVEDAKPFIPFKMFDELKDGQIISGIVDSAVVFPNQPVKAEVLVGTHVCRVTVWDRTLDDVIAMKGQPISMIFTGMDESGKYPRLRIKW